MGDLLLVDPVMMPEAAASEQNGPELALMKSVRGTAPDTSVVFRFVSREMCKKCIDWGRFMRARKNLSTNKGLSGAAILNGAQKPKACINFIQQGGQCYMPAGYSKPGTERRLGGSQRRNLPRKLKIMVKPHMSLKRGHVFRGKFWSWGHPVHLKGGGIFRKLSKGRAKYET